MFYRYDLRAGVAEPLVNEESSTEMKEKLFAYARCAYDFLDGNMPLTADTVSLSTGSNYD